MVTGKKKPGEEVLDTDPLTAIDDIDLPSLRRTARRARGSRLRASPSGKYRRAVRIDDLRTRPEIAADATLRAMALRRVLTGAEPRVEREDLRAKLRLRPAGSLIVFALDTSDSMGIERRMRVAKGAVIALLVTAQVTGDRVALVSFQGDGAEVLLQPTVSLERARARLRRVPIGGATPLGAGLTRCLELIRSERRRDASIEPRLVLLTDGAANVPRVPGADVQRELDAIANTVRAEHVSTLVLDTNPPFETSCSLRRIADRMGAIYRRLHEVDARSLSALLSSDRAQSFSRSGPPGQD